MKAPKHPVLPCLTIPCPPTTTANERPQRPAHTRPVRCGAPASGKKSGENPTTEILQSLQQAAGHVGLAALFRAAGRTCATPWLHQATAGRRPAGTGMAGGESGDDAGGVTGDGGGWQIILSVGGKAGSFV